VNILVVDVAAESGGGLSILHDFYNEIKTKANTEDCWLIAISTPHFEESDSIRILKYPWIKKSWLHRIYFDYFYLPKLVKENNIDKIISLQNIRVPNTKVFQVLYVHNSLPFVDHRFSVIESSYLWIYQNLIGKLIIKSITKADYVIVQSEWMKKACIRKTAIDSDKVIVLPPVVIKEIPGEFTRSKTSQTTFFYPASAQKFKNHILILEACYELKQKKIENYSVIFTLLGNENQLANQLYTFAKKYQLPVEFIGTISRKDVFGYYLKTILLFPSYIESSPLPLSEAQLYQTPILASDYPFSREVLEKYNKVTYFNAFNSKELSEKMENFINFDSLDNDSVILPLPDAIPSLYETVRVLLQMN
jgi:glycosyltransferase involved in cell wall biosynthesis